ncbi:MAG: MBL fold metallo-hydrolase RNA specificity domain-containing protein [Peptococcales bacterium]|jgi:metallo-beta-lactamase family protein
MKIAFYGATETVTGSCFEITTNKGYRILVDCGLYQGPKEIKERNYGDFPFDPTKIDAVLLTHAHIDHSGLIPKLCKKGFKGKIYTTEVTVDLCSIMLPDSGYIQEMEVERKNRKLARANKELLEPIYTVIDAEKCMKQFVGVAYNKKIEILPEIQVKFKDAGHILGSAMIEVFADDLKVLFSGDIGNINQPIINDPTIITEADYIVMESTYGNRFHLETEDKMSQLIRIIKKTFRKGGNLVIPAFAVERTQGLIYNLKKLDIAGEIPDMDVYLDSPLAIKATEIFCKYPELYDEEAGGLNEKFDECILNFPGLKYSLTADESKAINFLKNSKIIISASGMCDAGRIKHHLKHNLWRSDSTILFVGYQAQGTLGRRILDGEKTVRIHGEEIAVNADIERIEGFSAHADQKTLVEWVKHFSKKPQKIFLVHGEQNAMLTLAKVIEEETQNSVIIPKFNQTIELTKSGEITESIGLQEKEIAQSFKYFEETLQSFLNNSENRSMILLELEKLKEKIIN